MNDYFIKKEERKIQESHRAADFCLQSVREFVYAYNELREQASAMPETTEEMPALTTDSLHALLGNPQAIKNLYLKTIAVPELAGGFKVKMDTLDIKHADYETPISYAMAAKDTIRKQIYADFSAYVVREEGTKVIVSDKWKEAVEERHTERAVTPVEKKVYDIIKQIYALRDELKKTTGIDLNAQAFGDNMARKWNFDQIYNRHVFGYRRKELIEETAATDAEKV